MTTIIDLQWKGHISVLVYYRDLQPALWVEDEYLSGKLDDPGSPYRYALNDGYETYDVSPYEDLDEIRKIWEEAVDSMTDAKNGHRS